MIPEFVSLVILFAGVIGLAAWLIGLSALLRTSSRAPSPVSWEDRTLARLRDDYLADRVSVEYFERRVGETLNGVRGLPTALTLAKQLYVEPDRIERATRLAPRPAPRAEREEYAWWVLDQKREVEAE